MQDKGAVAVRCRPGPERARSATTVLAPEEQRCNRAERDKGFPEGVDDGRDRETCLEAWRIGRQQGKRQEGQRDKTDGHGQPQAESRQPVEPPVPSRLHAHGEEHDVRRRSSRSENQRPWRRPERPAGPRGRRGL